MGGDWYRWHDYSSRVGPVTAAFRGPLVTAPAESLEIPEAAPLDAGAIDGGSREAFPVSVQANPSLAAKRATLILRAIAAKAYSVGQLSRDEIDVLRVTLKRGRRPHKNKIDVDLRSSADGARFLNRTAREFEARARQIASRLDEPTHVWKSAIDQADEELGLDTDVGVVEDSNRDNDGVLSLPARVTSGPGLAELANDEQEEVAKRHELMLLLERGVPVEWALTQAQLTGTKRWVRKLRAQYKERGFQGLIDGRRANGRSELVSKGAREELLRCYFARKGAGPKVLYDLLVLKRPFDAPSYPWVKWYIRERISAAVKLARDEGIDAWVKQAAPVSIYEPTTFSNQMWQIDHTLADIWVRVQQPDGSWAASQVWVTAILDVHSRAVMSFTASTRNPDAWTTAVAVRKAILPKANTSWKQHGMCWTIVPDHGKDFFAKSNVTMFKALGIIAAPCPAHYPNMKGEVERWFGTFQRGLLPRFPGYKGSGMKSAGAAAKQVPSLLTLSQLKDEIERWIVTVYHKRPQERVGTGPVDYSPDDLWERSAHVRMPEERELDVLLLKMDKVRTVTNVGIKLKLKTTGRLVFWHPELVQAWRTKVALRYNPEDVESVLVYHADTGQLLCEAWRMGEPNSRFTHRDIVRERKRARRGVAARLKNYMDTVERDDRDTPASWDRARAIAAGDTAGQIDSGGRHPKPVSAKSHVTKAPALDTKRRTPNSHAPAPPVRVLSLLELMERSDRIGA